MLGLADTLCTCRHVRVSGQRYLHCVDANMLGLQDSDVCIVDADLLGLDRDVYTVCMPTC